MRESKITRKTKETDVSVKVNIDGNGQYDIQTGIGFFDHMLNALSKHSGINLTVKTAGDLEVDAHHTVEDTGIVIGQALAEALGKAAITRYGSAFIPMDEALGFCSLDISNRPYLVFDAEFTSEKCGDFDTSLTEEFFRALSVHGGITLHMKKMYGKNDHHAIEAMFKAFAYALKAAVKPSDALLSTKGTL